MLQNQKITTREKESEAQHTKILEQAVADIEAFYEEYNKNKQQIIEQNRKNNSELENASQNNQNLPSLTERDNEFWDVVRKTADKIKRPKNTKDTSRMRQIMQSFSAERQ